MKKAILISLLTLNLLLGLSQVKSIKRIEINTNDDVQINNYFQFGEYGLIQENLNLDKNKKDKSQIYTTFKKYDTNLELTDSIEVSRDNYLNLNISYISKDNLYMLYYDMNGNFEAIQLDIKTLKIKKLSGKFISNSFSPKMKAINNTLYILNEGFRGADLEVYDFESNTISSHNYKAKKVNRFCVLNFQVINDELILTLHDEINKVPQIELYIYNKEKLINSFITPNYNKEKFILTSSVSKLQDNSYIIAGTYSPYTMNSGIVSFEKPINLSTGIYTLRVSENKEKFIEFVNYKDINNFYNYLPEKEKEKIEKKIIKLEGKEFNDKKYNVLTHDIIEENNKFILIGEAYYESYSSHQSSSGNTIQVLEGYISSHFFIVSFDQNGKINWSNSNTLGLMQKKIKTSITPKLLNGKFNLAFKIGNKFHLYSYDEGKLENNSITELEVSNSDEEKAKFTVNTETESWYNNYYISYGKQELVNKNDKRDKRKVNFLNKIEFNY